MTSLEIAGFVRFRIAQVFRWTADDTEASYLANDERQAAVERNFIAIGEAINAARRQFGVRRRGVDTGRSGPTNVGPLEGG